MKVLAVYNIKGGVGKTTAAVNFSYLVSIESQSVLLWDFDSQSAATYSLRIKPKLKGGARKLFRRKKGIEELIKGTDYEDFDLLPADFSYRKLERLLSEHNSPVKILKALFKQVAPFYDYLFLDCAPGLSKLSLTIFQAVDVILVPTIPNPLAIRPLEQMDYFLKKMGAQPLVLPFFSMVDRRKSLHRDAVEHRLMEPFPFLLNYVPYSSFVEQMGVRREPLPAFLPGSSAAGAFSTLWAEIKTHLRS